MEVHLWGKLDLEQGSPAPRPRLDTGPWPFENWSAQGAGKRVKLHLCKWSFTRKYTHLPLVKYHPLFPHCHQSTELKKLGPTDLELATTKLE